MALALLRPDVSARTSPEPEPADVLVVVVSWNSAAWIEAAVRSVPEETPLVVVDNASTDGSADVAEKALGGRPESSVLRLPANVGFGPACNLGAAAWPSRTILFLNPDAALEDGARAVATLLEELDRDASLAAVAPALRGDGQEAFQLRRLPTLSSLAREAFFVNRLRPRNRGFLGERYLDRDRSAPFDVEQPAAAALLVSRRAFERIGGFDERFAPAWWEDVDLCARFREAGYRLRFVPAAAARHVGGSSLSALPYRDFVPLYTRNLLLYLARHARWPTRVLGRAILGAGALLRLLLLPFVSGDHGRLDTAVAYARVVRGLAGLGWRSALLGGGAPR